MLTAMRVEVEGGVAGWKGVKLDKNPKIPLSGFTQKRLEGWGWGREGCGGGGGGHNFIGLRSTARAHAANVHL